MMSNIPQEQPALIERIEEQKEKKENIDDALDLTAAFMQYLKEKRRNKKEEEEGE